MSHTRAAEDVGRPVAAPRPERPAPRVRHLAREALVLMAFSAFASTTLAGCLLLITTLGHQG